MNMNEQSFLGYIKAKFSDVVLHREQMHGYQGTGLEFMRRNPFSALFIDMGLGKTVTSATLIADLIAEFANDDKILIIGPLRVATQTWPDEFRKWSHLAHLNISVVHVDEEDPRLKEAAKEGRERGKRNSSGLFTSQKTKDGEEEARRAVAAMKTKIRQEAAMSSATVHVVSQDWVEWLVDFYREKWPYRTVFVDESSGFKNHKSARFLALQSVRDQPNKLITRLHLLTATPAAETYDHLFAQIYLLDRGERLGRDINRFRNKYMVECKYTRKWKLRPDGERDILALISDICLVQKEEDYLPRVEPLFVTREVVMSDSQMALYAKLAEDMVVTLDDGSEIVAETAAALSSKLLQMASGVLYETKLLPGQSEDDDHVKILKVHQIHTHKIDELKQIMEEAQGRPILVGYHFRASKDRIKAAFGKDVTFMDPDGKCIKAWNKGKIPMLAMHPKSGGHGLNLQTGGHIIVFFDIPWSLELYLQFIGRLSRQGQKHRVTVFLLVCRDTLDSTVVNALTAKEDAQDMLFKILKRMRRKLRKLLKGRKKISIGDPQWDEVVDILRDYENDEPRALEEHCPNCGDIGGPCGPGSDCYDDL